MSALFRVLDERVGDVAILPAEAFYAARFGLPMRTFRAATTDRHYRRSYRDLSWEPNALDFRDPTLREASVGTRAHERGLALTGRDAAIVFTAGWPYATGASLELDVERPTSIRLQLGTTFGRCDLGERRAALGRSAITFDIPPGCFDSGLVELRFQSDHDEGVVIERLVLDDSTSYPPPY